MPTDIVIATDKPGYTTTGRVTASSSTYDAAVPTATAPSTTSQTALLVTNLGDKPSLLRLLPFHSSNAATSVGVRVVGWTSVPSTGGTTLYFPTVLADLTLGYTSGSVPSISLNGNTEYTFSSATVGAGVPTVNLYSPATAALTNIQPASAVIDCVGHQYITLQFKSSTGTMGALYAFI